MIIVACPYCGSREVTPRVLFGGPMATVDNDDGTYRCHECGRTVRPITFSSAEEWVLFRQSIMKQGKEEIKKGFLHIPIVPVDTRPLFSMAGIDLPFVKVTEVVSVNWQEGRLERSDYAAKFDRYWNAVAGKMYNASEIMLMDLSGIQDARPNFRALRELVKRKYDIWLDLGIRSEQDIFDAFSVEISHAMASTSTISNKGLFQELFDLSDRCIPCIQTSNGRTVWASNKAGSSDLRVTLDYLSHIGYEKVAVFDLDRLGRKTGVSSALLGLPQQTEMKVFIGGGVLESDLKEIEEHGFVGAFIDPFTPVIEEALQRSNGSPSETIFPLASTEPAKRPKYLATD